MNSSILSLLFALTPGLLADFARRADVGRNVGTFFWGRQKLARGEYRATGRFLSRVFFNNFCICSFFLASLRKIFACPFGQLTNSFPNHTSGCAPSRKRPSSLGSVRIPIVAHPILSMRF